ncbi:MAG: GTPase ObgE [Chthonomonas sp.]|nr:GTPase ObgE [Chthonomonas sp.]
MFLDEALVEFTSGTGGSGAVAFHREKHVPRGGPNGADGGRGGDIILVAERGCRTLFDFKLRGKFRADDGVHAVGNKRGKNGKDIILKVPVGTVVHDLVLNEVIADLTLHGMKVVIAKGGRGGFGNAHYVSSVRQVPNFAQKGAPGEVLPARLELKLLADVGLIGLPNAGKSTLLGRVSAAKPKVADYPFTTIVPNLGVARVANDTFVVADMPGLIEGASQGHGLGHQFLRHIERTKVLVHVVDIMPIDESDPLENFHLIEEELMQYNAEVAKRPRVVALSKIDVLPSGEFNAIRERFESLGLPLFPISAVTGQGIEPLMFEVYSLLQSAEEAEPIAVLLPAQERKMDDNWEVTAAEEGGYEIKGKRILRMAAMTDLGNRDAIRYLHRRLQRLGIITALEEMGAQEGDNVYIGDFVFSFSEW